MAKKKRKKYRANLQHYDESRHIESVKLLCSRSVDQLEAYVAEDGRRIKACPDCLTLKQITKKCLSCDHKFTPTCMVKFLCQICYERNIKEHHINYSHKKY